MKLYTTHQSDTLTHKVTDKKLNAYSDVQKINLCTEKLH